METDNNQKGLGFAMLPFVMRELVELVMKKKALPLADALYYIYSSRLYASLLDESTKQWYSSTLSLYEQLEHKLFNQLSFHTAKVTSLLKFIEAIEAK